MKPHNLLLPLPRFPPPRSSPSLLPSCLSHPRRSIGWLLSSFSSPVVCDSALVCESAPLPPFIRTVALLQNDKTQRRRHLSLTLSSLADICRGLSISMYDMSGSNHMLTFLNIHVNSFGADGNKFDTPQPGKEILIKSSNPHQYLTDRRISSDDQQQAVVQFQWLAEACPRCIPSLYTDLSYGNYRAHEHSSA